jgi:hypothetical protein
VIQLVSGGLAHLTPHSPILRIERVNAGTLGFRAYVIPNCGKRKHLVAIDNDSTSHTKWATHRKDLTRGARDDFGLEPSMYRALPRMNFPGEIGSNTADITNLDSAELRFTQRTSHWGSGANFFSRWNWNKTIHWLSSPER